MRLIWAFIKRDFLIESSYNLFFVMRIFRSFFFILIFFFISRLMKDSPSPHLAVYGGDYFSFVLMGLILVGYQNISMNGTSDILRNEQVQGTLESLLMMPTRILSIIVCSTIYRFIQVTIDAIIYMLMGIVFFGVQLNPRGIITAAFAVLLAIGSFGGLGLMSVGFTLIFKRGNPINLVMGTLSHLLGGVYFPITILPAYLSKISAILPTTHALNSIRLALFMGEGARDLLNEFLFLIIFSALALPAGVIFLSIALKKAKKDGSLAHY